MNTYVKMISEAIRLNLIKVEPKAGMWYYDIFLNNKFLMIDDTLVLTDDIIPIPSQEDLQVMILNKYDSVIDFFGSLKEIAYNIGVNLTYCKRKDSKALLEIMILLVIHKLHSGKYRWDSKTETWQLEDKEK